MTITQKWSERFTQCRETGRDEFSYAEIAEMFGIAQANVAQKFKDLATEHPGSIVEANAPDVKHKVFRLNYDILIAKDYVPKPEPEMPEWMSRATWDAIQERLDLPSGYRLEYRTTEWAQRFQRGRVVVTVYEVGQKYADREAVMLIDNCIIVN